MVCALSIAKIAWMVHFHRSFMIILIWILQLFHSLKLFVLMAAKHICCGVFCISFFCWCSCLFGCEDFFHISSNFCKNFMFYVVVSCFSSCYHLNMIFLWALCNFILWLEKDFSILWLLWTVQEVISKKKKKTLPLATKTIS